MSRSYLPSKLASEALTSVAPSAAPETALQRALTRIGNAPLRTGNHLVLLRNGSETFEDWLAAIAGAQRWIHLENYIFKADAIGQRFADALIERAQAGVSVRVLYDWFGSWDVPLAFWRRLRTNGVDVRAVNSLTMGAPIAAINRDHRKLLAVDGTYASIGGVCIADAWLNRSPVTGLPYRDTAVRVAGPAVADLERAFADVWAVAGSPLPEQECPAIERMAASGDVAVRVIAEEPGRMRMLGLLQLALATAEQRLWIADAYFLAVPPLREALINSARAGVDVRLLVPATNDLPFVGAWSRSGYRPFLEAGVRIWEYAGLMMHAKTSVGDGCWSRIGSTNLNVTGLLTNWEIDVLAEDCRFGAQMERMYEEDLANSREIRLSGPVRRQQPRPDRQRSPEERQASRDRAPGSASASATVARVGAAWTAARNDELFQQERTISAAIGAGALTLSVLVARFPRLLAWPIAAIGAFFGGTTLARTLRIRRSSSSQQP